jgi:hypothetical protein
MPDNESDPKTADIPKVASPIHKADGALEFPAEINADASTLDAAELQRRADAQDKVIADITPEEVVAARNSPAFRQTVGVTKAAPSIQKALAEAIARRQRIYDAEKARLAFPPEAPDGVVAGEGGDGPVRFGTTPTDDYLPTYGISPILTVVTTSASPATWSAQGVEDYTPPPRSFMNHEDNTLTGTLAGKKLVTITVEKSATIQLTQIYGTKHYAYLDPIVGVNYCVITLTLNDGSIYAGIGGITSAVPSQQSDNNSLKTAITIVMNGGWTYTVGTTGPTNA